MSKDVQEPARAWPGGQSVSGSTVGGHLNQVHAHDVTIYQNQQMTSRPPLPDAATVDGPSAGTGPVGLPRLPAVVFDGRQNALKRVHVALTGPKPDMVAGAVITQAAVHGLGGIGKSELALQYANAHHSAYRLVCWIDADAPAQIQTGLAALARALCAGVHSVAAAQATTEEAAAWAMSWLASRTGWLLIFDNVERPDDLHPYLGRLSGGSVLITTRRDIGWRTLGCVPIDLGVLDARAATAVLADLIGLTSPSPSELADLAALAEDLGFLPLALRQAGAFIAHIPDVTVPAYRHMLHTSPARAHAAAPAGHPEQAVIARVWTLTRQRIASLDSLAPRLLSLLACYAPDQLPIAVLSHLPGTDKMQIGQALDLLASYSMITISPDRSAVSVHRLVQAVTLNDLSEEERQAVRDQAAALLTAELPPDPNVIGNWPAYRRLLAHARVVFSPRAEVMYQVIDYLHASGDYTTAKTLQRQRYQAQLDHHGPEHPDTLFAQADLAYCTGQAGDPVEAREQFATLLPIRERVLGALHRDTLTTRANLAYWSGEAGDADGARDQYAELLSIYEHILGTDHHPTLAARHNLGRWSGEAGDASGAREQFAALLPICERVLGAEDPDTLSTRHELARWTGQAGDPVEAREQFAALLPIRKRVLGAKHPDTLTARRQLAYWARRCRETSAPGPSWEEDHDSV
ncbi:tetratricopeptide repeat protein [Herbidospora sp. NEAU-GS84]|uniref:Tetratricopeptide repeat protein n=1 Tax=Herbidospora solisilvae TaxID=2696284 RepID=A0A7C9K2F7_9ACTN|nr:tetratricopeptide repeat protein [Herbidospora solisilvae]NAS27379.1 tetratricopeptide repeat protein [Herbidospora solisilvae]